MIEMHNKQMVKVVLQDMAKWENNMIAQLSNPNVLRKYNLDGQDKILENGKLALSMYSDILRILEKYIIPVDYDVNTITGMPAKILSALGDILVFIGQPKSESKRQREEQLDKMIQEIEAAILTTAKPSREHCN